MIIVKNKRMSFKPWLLLLQAGTMACRLILDGDSSGVLVKCVVPCVVIGGQRWEENLQFIHNSIVFIDECNRFIKSEDFAVRVKESDNYFVIVTRDDLPNLPYSVKEIYGIRNSGKYAGLKQVYNEFYCFAGKN